MPEPIKGRVSSPWGAAYLDTTELSRRLRRVQRRLADRCTVPEIMTEEERDLTRDYCRAMETLHARREANDG